MESGYTRGGERLAKGNSQAVGRIMLGGEQIVSNLNAVFDSSGVALSPVRGPHALNYLKPIDVSLTYPDLSEVVGNFRNTTKLVGRITQFLVNRETPKGKEPYSYEINPESRQPALELQYGSGGNPLVALRLPFLPADTPVEECNAIRARLGLELLPPVDQSISLPLAHFRQGDIDTAQSLLGAQPWGIGPIEFDAIKPYRITS